MSAEQLRNSFRAYVLRGEKPPLVIAEKHPRQEGAHDTLGADLVARSEERSSNHRHGDRHRLTGETAKVVYGDRTVEAEIVNLSAGGAMIRAAFEPKLWDILQVELGRGFVIEAAVRWLKDGYIGLEFAHETRIDCDPSERAALLLEVIRRSFDDQEIHLAREDSEVPLDPEEPLGQREAKRHPLIWMGEIHYAHDSNPVRLRNVSEGGALIDVAVDYPLGAEVLLDLREAGQFLAVIQWIAGDQAGLHFRQPFDIACLARARPEVAPVRWVRPTFLDRDPDEEDSPWHTNWTRSSVAEVRSELEGYLKR